MNDLTKIDVYYEKILSEGYEMKARVQGLPSNYTRFKKVKMLQWEVIALWLPLFLQLEIK